LAIAPHITGNRADSLPHIIEKSTWERRIWILFWNSHRHLVHQAAGQVETTADAAGWTLWPSRSLQLCIFTYRSCCHPAQ